MILARERSEKCPYCGQADIEVDPVMCEGHCDACDRDVTFDPED